MEKHFLRLQRRFAALQKSGALVSVVSMNDVAEVEKVFDLRADDLALKREHVVSMSVNWEPKVRSRHRLFVRESYKKKPFHQLRILLHFTRD